MHTEPQPPRHLRLAASGQSGPMPVPSLFEENDEQPDMEWESSDENESIARDLPWQVWAILFILVAAMIGFAWTLLSRSSEKPMDQTRMQAWE